MANYPPHSTCSALSGQTTHTRPKFELSKGGQQEDHKLVVSVRNTVFHMWYYNGI